jgi:hypothetical protein
MRRLRLLLALAGVLLLSSDALADDRPTFLRAINLNGPSLEIDGRAWEGQDSKHYRCKDRAFENQAVPLVPATDEPRAKMIRSSRWGGNEVVLTDLPAGEYSLFLYVWEDNNAEVFSVSVNGREVLKGYNSGQAGRWEKLGPWVTQSVGGEIKITSTGGAANFSGIEIWRGAYSETAELNPEHLKFFEAKIRPALVAHCYECHSARSKSVGAELRLDTRSGWSVGGEHGPAIVPGQPEKSLLVKAIRHDDDELRMPPEEKLPEHVIADLTKWIELGAPDPRDDKELALLKRDQVLGEAQQRWAFTPPIDAPPPEVMLTAWPYNGIDHFILAKLEANGLKPVGDAEKRALIRRATFDLIGLPPSPAEVEAFLADDKPGAFDCVIDRLLDSPRYGERWGRYWLDVVRYADTAGDNSDFPIPQMRLYRDWVIEAFNRDLPYDQFLQQQLAGDLLPAENDAQHYQQVIATGYIANARRFGSRVDDYPQHLTIEDTLDNLGRAMLGLSLNCARCHDHKFDPVVTEDYYALYGIFNSTRYPWPGIELEQKQRDLVPLVSEVEAMRVMNERRQKQTALDDRVKELEKERDAASGEQKESLKKQVDEARREAEQHARSPLPFATAYAVAEGPHPADAEVQYKGDPAKPGITVPRRFLLALGGQTLATDDRTSGRLSLARCITERQNPLAARVMVNRIWNYHFGRGIVATPNDFGKQGKAPTHPELLDWLAHRFVESGWSVKAMHRLMMRSHTYQLAAIHDPAAIPGDPANDLLSGFRPRRLDAEALRDTLLLVSGKLDLEPAGDHPFPPTHEWKFTQHNPFRAVYPSNHRSVYLMTQRIQRHPYLAIFDGPDPNASTAVRLTSTTPLQALFLLNDPFVHEQASGLAERIRKSGERDGDRIPFAYELLLARPASETEVAAGQVHLAKARELLQKAGMPKGELESAAWESYARSLLLLSEFAYVD